MVKKHDDMTRKEIGKRMDELARRYADTHDENIKAQLVELSRQLSARISNRQGALLPLRIMLP